MHSVRRALVQSNRDIGLVNLMQIGEASAEDLEWCTLNRVETSSDLQYISAAHTPKGRTLERLWKKLQRQPSGIVASILQEEKRTHQVTLEKSLQKRVKPRLWLPSKRQRARGEPTTVPRDKQLRMDTAAAVVDSSWSWAPLSHGLGHDVPDFVTAGRRAAQTKALATAFEANLTHGAVGAWRQLKAWFQAQHVALPNQMWPSVFVEVFLQHVNEKSGEEQQHSQHTTGCSGWSAGPRRHLASKMYSPQSSQRKVEASRTEGQHQSQPWYGNYWTMSMGDRRPGTRPSYRVQLQTPCSIGTGRSQQTAVTRSNVIVHAVIPLEQWAYDNILGASWQKRQQMGTRSCVA